MLTSVTNPHRGTAIFDESGQYRYCLTRSWSASPRSHVTFIMLNPSQADANHDDPTLRACSQFAQRWGYSKLEIVNLFAYRTAYPNQLKQASDPIGPQNDRYLLEAAQSAEKIILAWGNWGSYLQRAAIVITLLQTHHHKLYCLECNTTGQPRHPLYIKRNVLPQGWASALI